MSDDFDYGNKRPDGQYERHPVAVGSSYVQPLRNTYRHIPCQGETTFGDQIAETYATNPHYYNRTFCIACHDYFPLNQFIWLPDEVPLTEVSGEPGLDLRRSRY